MDRTFSGRFSSCDSIHYRTPLRKKESYIPLRTTPCPPRFLLFSSPSCLRPACIVGGELHSVPPHICNCYLLLDRSGTAMPSGVLGLWKYVYPRRTSLSHVFTCFWHLIALDSCLIPAVVVVWGRFIGLYKLVPATPLCPFTQIGDFGPEADFLLLSPLPTTLVFPI